MNFLYVGFALAVGLLALGLTIVAIAVYLNTARTLCAMLMLEHEEPRLRTVILWPLWATLLVVVVVGTPALVWMALEGRVDDLVISLLVSAA